jgi:methionine synthase II (cobalamin-independent)
MFATLLGGLPRPDQVEGSPIEAVIRAQETAGLEPITDGRLGDPGRAPVERWRIAAGLTDRAVKEALPGPYTRGRQAPEAGGSRSRAAVTMAIAEAIRREVEALAAAGCPLVEIEEAEAHLIGEDEAERELFCRAHRVITDGIAGTHLSLSIVGVAATSAGIETILDAPYASLAVDLITGPDSWNLVTATPGDRGIVVGVLGAREMLDEPKEVLLWAAHYAASTGGRGIARVGIGSAGSYENLTWTAALRKMQGLGTAARLAALPPGDELAREVDPRSIDARTAAMGRTAPNSPRR